MAVGKERRGGGDAHRSIAVVEETSSGGESACPAMIGVWKQKPMPKPASTW